MQLLVILVLNGLRATHQTFAIMTPSWRPRGERATRKKATPEDRHKDEYPGRYLRSQLCEFAR